MSRFVRASKVRHVYAEEPKTEQCYSDIRLSTATGDQNYIKGNTKFFAVAVRGGGGSLLVNPYERTGKLRPGVPVVAGHRANVTDFDFNPFHEHVLATGSEDCTVKVWGIPEEGLTENLTDALAELPGHSRKVLFTVFHPTAASVLVTAGGDQLVKVWDIESGAERTTLTQHDCQLQDLKWSYDGSLLVTSGKDKIMRLLDVRANEVVQSTQPHEGSKSFKVEWLGSKERLVSVGFTKQSKRHYCIWDPRNLAAPLKSVDLDQAAGVIMPFFDDDSNILFLAGKGDGNVRYFEMVDEDPWEFALSEYKSTKPTKGMCMLPRRMVDVGRCELARMLKLTGAGEVEPLSFICPRKAEGFQEDLYPDAISGEPALTADEWFGGETRPPNRQSMREPVAIAAAAAAPPMRTVATLQRELDDAHRRIAELEAEVARLKA